MLAFGVGTCVLTTSVPVFAAPPAEAEPAAQPTGDEPDARAMKAYRDGQEAYDSGHYSDALELFLEAQSLYPSPDFHYNIGKCHEALESYEQAVVSYKAYLRSYKSAYNESPADEVNIQNKIDRLEKQVEADRAAAEAAANREPEVIIKEVPGKNKKPGMALIITGGVLAGVGVGVGVVGAAVFGVAASDASNRLEDVYENGNPERLPVEDARALGDKGSAAEFNQILMLSIGSAVAVTGVALLAVGVVKRKKARAADPRYVSGLRVAPAFGRDSGGLVIGGRF